MAARDEEFAQKIEQSIREAVERMVTDIRSSIDDVRDAVNQQLEAASQSVQADAKSLSLRSHLDEIFAAEPEEVPVELTEAPARSSAAQIKSAVRAIEQGKSQVEVLNALLDQSLHFSSRCALFILKGGSFAGWKGAGFTASGGSDDEVKRFAGSPADVEELGRVLDDHAVVDWDGASVAAKLKASTPSRATIIPMVIKDKVAAALYADAVDGAEENFDRPALELLVFTTGLLIDTLAIRKMVPSPALSGRDEGSTEDATPVVASSTAPASIPAAPAAPKPEPEPPPRQFRAEPEQTQPHPVAAAPAFEPPAAASRPEPEPEPERIEPPRAPAHTFEAPAPPRPPGRSFELDAEPASSVSTPEPPPAPPIHPTPPPVRPAMPAAGSPTPQARPQQGTPGTGAEKPSTQYIPPAGVTGGRIAAQQNLSAETKKHDEAKRFARLLVSEIKLYNESKVDEGRKHRDLYERMKDDIDRSRQMYEERIAEDVRRQSNYFYDELVRILADGSAELLGL
ncbi:MAG: hypothetical protein ABR524_01545 [Thermoanaerobaculia bacterium]